MRKRTKRLMWCLLAVCVLSIIGVNLFKEATASPQLSEAEWQQRTATEDALLEEFQAELRDLGYESSVLSSQYEERTDFKVIVEKEVISDSIKKEKVKNLFSTLADQHSVQNYNLIIESDSSK